MTRPEHHVIHPLRRLPNSTPSGMGRFAGRYRSPNPRNYSIVDGFDTRCQSEACP
jgi:hypothetical protein